MIQKILYIVLIAVVIIIFIKLKGGKTCNPKCRLSVKTKPRKKPKTYKESLEETRKKIEKINKEKEEKK